jgi:Uma2 family endonuclease
MNIALKRPWTAEQFLDWAARQEIRYEFDGIQPVAMTGGNARHNRITQNIYGALRSRLRGTPCSLFGPDLAVRTVGEKVRCPDALITCTKFPDTERVAPDVVVVFEVLSPDSGQRDRIEKLQEYAAVPSIRRYVILEYRSKALLLFHRANGDAPWTAQALKAEDSLPLPEVGIEVPIAEFYEDVEIPAAERDPD